MDVVGGGAGPRAALWLAVVLFGVGALLLRPVDERRREDAPPSLDPEDPVRFAAVVADVAPADAG